MPAGAGNGRGGVPRGSPAGEGRWPGAGNRRPPVTEPAAETAAPVIIAVREPSGDVVPLEDAIARGLVVTYVEGDIVVVRAND